MAVLMRLAGQSYQAFLAQCDRRDVVFWVGRPANNALGTILVRIVICPVQCVCFCTFLSVSLLPESCPVRGCTGLADKINQKSGLRGPLGLRSTDLMVTEVLVGSRC
eukprot:4833212-Prymnesium_polylepis.1